MRLAIVVMILLVSFGASAAPVRIACVGDSLTDSAYPKFLKEMCKDKCEVRTFAKKGASTVKMGSLLAKALATKPTHVVIFAGINDCADTNRPDPYKIFDRIAKMVSRVLDAGAVPVVVGLHTAGGHGIPAACASMVNIQLCDFPVGVIRVGWEGPRGLTDQCGGLYQKYDSGDGVHLNAHGYRNLARMVYEAIFK